MAFGMSGCPVGWVAADGAARATVTYPVLDAVLGTTWGARSGGNFQTPDLRGVFPKGAGTTNRAAGVDANGGYYAATLATYYQDKEQGHKHSVDPPSTTSGTVSSDHSHNANHGHNANIDYKDDTGAHNHGSRSGYFMQGSLNRGGSAVDSSGAVIANNFNTGGISANHTHNTDIGAVDSAVPKTDASNGTPRTGTTTEPQSVGVIYCIKY